MLTVESVDNCTYQVLSRLSRMSELACLVRRHSTNALHRPVDRTKRTFPLAFHKPGPEVDPSVKGCSWKRPRPKVSVAIVLLTTSGKRSSTAKSTAPLATHPLQSGIHSPPLALCHCFRVSSTSTDRVATGPIRLSLSITGPSEWTKKVALRRHVVRPLRGFCPLSTNPRYSVGHSFVAVDVPSRCCEGYDVPSIHTALRAWGTRSGAWVMSCSERESCPETMVLDPRMSYSIVVSLVDIPSAKVCTLLLFEL